MCLKLLADMRAAGVSIPVELHGMTESEIEEVRLDQRVDFLPGRYVEFLKVMGRDAGPIWFGTDAFYPGILSLKDDALEILRDNDVSDLLPTGAIVFAIHQGYQIYWMTNPDQDDPPVRMYQEGTLGVARAWESFTECLIQDGCA